jgi:hypothetical protein
VFGGLIFETQGPAGVFVFAGVSALLGVAVIGLSTRARVVAAE